MFKLQLPEENHCSVTTQTVTINIKIKKLKIKNTDHWKINPFIEAFKAEHSVSKTILKYLYYEQLFFF